MSHAGPKLIKAVGQDFAGFINHQAIHKRELWVVIQYISGHGWVAILSIYCVDAWERHHKPRLQSIHNYAPIQATELPRCGTRSDQICKTTKPPTWNCWLWYDVPVAMGWLTYILHVLWIYGKGFTGRMYHIHIDALNPDHRPPKLCAKVLTDVQTTNPS